MDLSKGNYSTCPSTIQDVESDNIKREPKVKVEPEEVLSPASSDTGKQADTEEAAKTAGQKRTASSDKMEEDSEESDVSDVEADGCPIPQRSRAIIANPEAMISKTSEVRKRIHFVD